MTIILDPETGEKYTKHCHKLVLAARSPVFKAMFFGGIRNKESEIFLNENIRDKRVLDQFVTFIYTNQVPLEKDAEETVIPLLTVCQLLLTNANRLLMNMELFLSKKHVERLR